MSSGFLQELTDRGLIHQVSATPLAEELRRGPVTLYSGLDPTADSLHVGSLLPLITLLRFQRAGHRPIALIGGGTGFIGDPSGKDAERSLLSREQIEVRVGQTVDIDGRRREVIGIMPPETDLMDNRTEIWLPLSSTARSRSSAFETPSASPFVLNVAISTGRGLGLNPAYSGIVSGDVSCKIRNPFLPSATYANRLAFVIAIFT